MDFNIFNVIFYTYCALASDCFYYLYPLLHDTYLPLLVNCSNVKFLMLLHTNRVLHVSVFSYFKYFFLHKPRPPLCILWLLSIYFRMKVRCVTFREDQAPNLYTMLLRGVTFTKFSNFNALKNHIKKWKSRGNICIVVYI